MGSSRTRTRSGDAAGGSANASPTRSPSIEVPSRAASEDAEDTVTGKRSGSEPAMQNNISSRPERFKRARSTPSIEREDGFGLWSESEIDAIAAEVSAKKSVDVTKLFNSPNNSPLPEPLKKRSRAELKAFIDRLKSSLDTSVAPWVPKCFVPELLSALASEAYFVRTSWEQLRAMCKELDKHKAEYNNLSRQCHLTYSASKRLSNQISVEGKRREAAEACRAVGEETANGVKKDIEDTLAQKAVLESELNNWRLNELETRRRLDRIRLKVAALRGEMVTTTVDELVRPPPKWMTDVGESVTSAESGDVESEHAGKNSNRSSGFSSINGDTAKNSVDKDGDAAMEVEENNASEIEKPESVDMEVALSETHMEEDVADEEDTLEDDDDTGFDEDGVSMELRLLKYRLDMYEREADEWRRSTAAELVKIGMVEKAKKRLEEELIRYRTGNGNDRRATSSAAKAKARRAAQAQLEELPIETSVKRRRKGIARRSLAKASS